jgi:ubiquitin-protein ligase E3 C
MALVVELMQQDGQRVWVNALQGAVVEQTEQAASEVDKGALIRLARNAFASQLVPDVASGRDQRRNRDSEHAVIHFLGHVYSTLPIVRLLRTTESELEAGVRSPLPAGLAEDVEEEEITTQFTHGGVAALELTVNYTQRQLARQQQLQIRSIASSAPDAIALLQSLLDPKLVSTWFEIVRSSTADSSSIAASEQERKRAKYLLGEDLAVAASSVPQLCLMYGQLIMALPVKQATVGAEALLFAGSATSVLNALSFGSKHQPLVTRLWTWISTHTDVSSCAALVKLQAKRRSPSSQESENRWESSVFADSAMPIAGVLYIFFITFAHHLIAVDDEEFYTGSPLPLPDVVAVTRMLRDLLFRLYWTYPVLCQQLLHETNSGGKLLPGSSPIGSSSNSGGVGGNGGRTVPLFDAQFVLAATRLFNQLAERNDRREFLDLNEWLWSGISEHDFDLAVNPDDLTFSADDDDVFRFRDPRVRWIVNSLPQVVPFAQRAKIFQELLDIDRSQVQGGDHHFGFASAQIQVRRDHILEDAFDEMNNLGARLKGRIQVTFVSEHGYQEAGIDGGGVFKEFMDTLAQHAFDVSYGLFTSTRENMLVPNPASDLARADHLAYFEFIGRVLGKAIYEQILVEPVFAKVFLNIFLGRVNHIDDLYFLDAELYRSLLKLKHMPEEGKDVSTLELFFEATTHRFGETRTVELIPGGSSIRVTNDNVINYIHRLAHYKLNVETAQQCRALLRGFRDLIPVGWIRMFSARELQLLIGGDLRPIDVENMRRNTRYGGGYHDSQPYIQHFWDIVASMTPQQQANLLKFVTSCSRQPLLGFEQLSPPFCIQQIPTHDAHSPPGSQPRLPSASTCMNLLKLPKYDSLEMLREKLLYAIQANTGFELT